MPQLNSVAPGLIESTLQEAWENAKHTDRIRAALFNLVTYVSRKEELEKLNGLITSLTSRFPSRTLILIEDAHATEAYLTTEVSVDFIGDPQHLVSSEQVYIRYSSSKRAQVPFILTAHLLPDLPIYLLWAGMPHRDDPLLHLLKPYLTQAVFDPPKLDEITSFSHEICAIAASSHGGVSDLQWTALQGWRQAIGHAFDHPDRLHHLMRLEHLRIGYARSTDATIDHRLGAFYLQAWIAAQLRWEPLERASSRLRYENLYGPIVVELTEQDPGEHPGGTPLHLDGRCSDGYRFQYDVEPNGQYVDFKGETDQLCEIPSTLYLPRLSREQMLAKELFLRGTSEHYLRTMQLISLYDSRTAPIS